MDRFLTTVRMIDMVGSTELAAELRNRGWRELVQAPKVVAILSRGADGAAHVRR